MNSLIVLSGIDYAGKSRIVDEILSKKKVENLACKLDEEQRKIANSSSYDKRFEFYLNANLVLTEKINDALKRSDVLVDRYWLDTIATHNFLLEKKLEDSELFIDAINKNMIIIPDITIIPYIDELTIKARQIIKNPQHKFENDAEKLIRDQYSYMVLGDKLKEELKMNIHYINNTLACQKSALTKVIEIVDFLPNKS